MQSPTYTGTNSFITSSAYDNMTAVVAFSLSRNSTVGFGSSTGTFVQSGGAHNVQGDLIVGDQGGSVGQYTMTDGNLTVVGAITVGLLGGANFTQSGGTVTGGSMTIASGGSSVQPVDTYTLTGTGTLHITGDETVGGFGNGHFVQGTGADAPTHTVDGTLFIGNGPIVSPDASPNPREGFYTLNSGTLTTNKTSVGTQGIAAVKNGLQAAAIRQPNFAGGGSGGERICQWQ